MFYEEPTFPIVFDMESTVICVHAVALANPPSTPGVIALLCLIAVLPLFTLKSLFLRLLRPSIVDSCIPDLMLKN